jgi:acyl-CoA thioester hydrolase
MASDRLQHRMELRVRYSETDQLGTFYNSRALEWFECGRTEALRALGLPYAEMERRGAFLPLVEAHLNFRGRARYDDVLVVSTRISQSGRASMRFDMEITQADGAKVVDGHTVHAITDSAGRPIRCPAWLAEMLSA